MFSCHSSARTLLTVKMHTCFAVETCTTKACNVFLVDHQWVGTGHDGGDVYSTLCCSGAVGVGLVEWYLPCVKPTLKQWHTLLLSVPEPPSDGLYKLPFGHWQLNPCRTYCKQTGDANRCVLQALCDECCCFSSSWLEVALRCST